MSMITALERQLGLIEAQFNAVSSALMAANPDDVHASSAQLQQLAVEFLQMVDEYGKNSLRAPHLALRLQALAQGMPMVRENLLRRNAYVERALALLVPQAQAQATYADSNSPYGIGLRPSGQFKSFAA